MISDLCLFCIGTFHQLIKKKQVALLNPRPRSLCELQGTGPKDGFLGVPMLEFHVRYQEAFETSVFICFHVEYCSSFFPVGFLGLNHIGRMMVCAPQCRGKMCGTQRATWSAITKSKSIQDNAQDMCIYVLTIVIITLMANPDAFKW